MSQDDIFQKPLTQVVDFVFNKAVVDVFPDMIRRSVPGYDNIISMLGVFASQYASEKSRIYDLGCSLGAATLACHQQIPERHIKYYCIDNSQAMLDQCENNLKKHMPEASKTFVCDDVRNIEIENASMVILNFTLQFITPSDRLALIKKIHNGLQPNGCLVIAEKTLFKDTNTQNHMTEWHHQFKRANAYTELEISQKRAAIENVMIPDTTETHLSRLKKAGFQHPLQWFQCLNFSAFIAEKV
ncbi:MAG: tRNA (uridine-5-oxyacetic acid methyl ester) 34 synthase [uncultured Thiotrichaceae bacterium]|uniref:Carboxy-S-adenosyl-L-methionine synthase n=1 Tax=uncultured Thiotrichaceae bacterium TaxID=298394 RepID=A0A6S6TBM1_9GAMM|nr:MAG: tRNA (uridine-5-oxyacetic acid methyl ester) 34 synthase [uncultured Thiotrichaceae bacterium]